MEDRTRLDLFLAHRAALIDYAASIVGARSCAEDVVQEAYIRFNGAAGEARPADDIVQPVGYLYRIVRNLALDAMRHLAVENRVATGAILDGMPAPEPSPERHATDRAELRAVAAALAELPARTRAAFEMHRLEGATLQTVADRLGISVGLVHRLVKDALGHCADRLDALDR